MNASLVTKRTIKSEMKVYDLFSAPFLLRAERLRKVRSVVGAIFRPYIKTLKDTEIFALNFIFRKLPLKKWDQLKRLNQRAQKATTVFIT